jgi:hypothetical protein
LRMHGGNDEIIDTTVIYYVFVGVHFVLEGKLLKPRLLWIVKL